MKLPQQVRSQVQLGNEGKTDPATRVCDKLRMTDCYLREGVRVARIFCQRASCCLTSFGLGEPSVVRAARPFSTEKTSRALASKTGLIFFHSESLSFVIGTFFFSASATAAPTRWCASRKGTP